MNDDYNRYKIVLPNIPLNIIVAKWEYDGSSTGTITLSGGTYDYKDEEHDKIVYIQDISGENFLGKTVKPIIERHR